MGIQLGSSGNRGGRGRRRRLHLVNDINMTPFVDVMLVLLIVFMVAAPLLTVGVPIDLPRTQAPSLQGDATEPVTVSIRGDGTVFLQEQALPVEEVVARLKEMVTQNQDARIYVRGDQKADYGLIMQVMARLHAAGVARLALVTLEEGG